MPPIAVWDSPHTGWDNAVYSTEDNSYETLRRIIGHDHQADVLHLEGHIRTGNEYFVTEDSDFLSKRQILNDQLGVTILTPEELELLLSN